MDEERRSRWLRWGVVISSLFVLAGLTAAVEDGPAVGFDAPFLSQIAAIRTPELTSAVLVVTALGGGDTLAILTVSVALLLWWVSKRSALFVVLSAAGSGGLNLLSKLVIARPRPGPDVVEAVYVAAGYSFPSGHSMATTGLFLSVFFVARRIRPAIQLWVGLASGLLIVAVGTSRMYLGVHYPSDVVGGWVFGLAWVVAAYGWYRAAFGEPLPEAEEVLPEDQGEWEPPE